MDERFDQIKIHIKQYIIGIFESLVVAILRRIMLFGAKSRFIAKKKDRETLCFQRNFRPPINESERVKFD